MHLNVDVHLDYVIIEEFYYVARPSKLSPTQWLDIWKAIDPMYTYEDGFRKGYELGYSEGLEDGI